MVRRHRSATARRRPCSVPRRLTARLVAEEASGEEAAVAEEVLLAVVDSETVEVRSTHYFGLRKFVHAPLRSGSLIILLSYLTFQVPGWMKPEELLDPATRPSKDFPTTGENNFPA